MFFFYPHNGIAQIVMSYELPTNYSLKRATFQIVFTKLDLVQLYYQVPIALKEIQNTGVTSRFDLFEFLVMFFSLYEYFNNKISNQRHTRYVN